MPFGSVESFRLDQDWEAYVRRVKQYIALNKIDAELHVATLITLVGSECYSLMCDLCSPTQPENKTLDELVALVKDHLEPVRSEIAERHLFRQRKQLQEESVRDYLHNLKHLAKSCNFTGSAGTLEVNLRDQFVSGLQSEEMRSRLFAKKNVDYKRAVELALALEAAERHAVEACASGPSGQLVGIDGVPTGALADYNGLHRFGQGQPRRSGGRPCARCGKNTHHEGKCRFKYYSCDVCGEKGHLKAMCKKNQGKRDGGGGKKSSQDAYLELEEPEHGYHGVVKENETVVEMTPTIRARGPLCSFVILNNKHEEQHLFSINQVNMYEASLTVRHPLDCEKRRSYKFDIAAVGCDDSYSNTVPVHVTVADVNEFAPEFTQESYVATVEEGRVYDEIVRVEAVDKDCTPHFGDVCKYGILTDRSQPFTIDNDGIIKNTEALDYEVSHSHVISVIAYDCGMKMSAPVMVTIKVNKPCKAGWKGVAERVDYAPGTGPLALFPAARLDTCSSDERCPGVTKIQAAISLQASRAGTGCDRDTYALHSQKTICGLDSRMVDLLPGPGPGNEWAKSLKPDIGHDDGQMFEFDGETTSAIVPPSVLPHHLSGTFSMTWWLRHAPSPDMDKHRKEHILCLADDHKMNRHHYALFVRNCRLIFLLRRDFGEGDLNIFRPAEWRWKIPEVCDNEWHHYAINVRFPNVELLIDGEPYRSADGKGPEVIDDWPLHPAHDVNTTMVVGACWQGTESDMKHHLRGWLAGLGVWGAGVTGGGVGVAGGRVGDTRGSRGAARCAAQCREGLSLAPGLYLKSVSVEGDGVGDVETLLRKVSYGDARTFPTPGRRNLRLHTTITCDNGRTISARPWESYIMVLQPQTPSISVLGSGEAGRDYSHFRNGVTVFPDLQIHVSSDQRIDEASPGGHIDSCVVSVYPALNPDHETLSVPDAADMLDGDIRAAVTRDGAAFSGPASTANYTQMLRSLTYSNKKPAYYLNRVFKLSCSALNGRFTSNEYVQTLTVVHPRMTTDSSEHLSGIADKMDAVIRDNEIESGSGEHVPLVLVPRLYSAAARRDSHSAELPDHTTRDNSASRANLPVSLVIAACAVGGLCAALGLALCRARTARARPQDMAWDDTALHITVNPMDQSDNAGGNTVEVGAESSDESDSDSEQHDSEDDEPVMSGKEHKYRNISQLEWDNSTM